MTQQHAQKRLPCTKTLPIRVRSKTVTHCYDLVSASGIIPFHLKHSLSSTYIALHYLLLFFFWSHSTTCSNKFTATVNQHPRELREEWMMLSGQASHEKKKKTRGVFVWPCHLHLLKSILRQKKKKNYRNFKYFTMPKYNLQEIL